MIASIPATRKLLMLDTCHAGAMGDAMMVARGTLPRAAPLRCSPAR